MITWRPVESSNVAAIGWPQSEFDVPDGVDPSQYGLWRPALLLVRFQNGKCFGYLGVSQQRSVYIATRCPSPGAYINRVIKPDFDAVRIPELDMTGPPF